MRYSRIGLIVLIVLVTWSELATPAAAQTRRKTRRARSAASNTQSDAVRTGANRVADQIKTLSRFVYLLGGVARGIESADEAVRRNEAPPAVVQQTARNKETVRTSLANVRQGLDDLEVYFRTTSALETFYSRLAGVAAGGANAEDQAAAGHYDAAGKALLDVINRLTDVLLEMR